MRTYNTVNDLLKTMENITRREVKHWRTDFSEYDAPAIRAGEYGGEPLAGREMLWITRECGTYFIPTESRDSLRAICDAYGRENITIRKICFAHDGKALMGKVGA